MWDPPPPPPVPKSSNPELSNPLSFLYSQTPGMRWKCTPPDPSHPLVDLHPHLTPNATPFPRWTRWPRSNPRCGGKVMRNQWEGDSQPSRAITPHFERKAKKTRVSGSGLVGRSVSVRVHPSPSQEAALPDRPTLHYPSFACFYTLRTRDRLLFTCPRINFVQVSSHDSSKSTYTK